MAVKKEIGYYKNIFFKEKIIYLKKDNETSCLPTELILMKMN
jgi:hypothetical protein